MKKLITLLVAAVLVFSVAGCKQIEGALEDAGLVKGQLTGEALYSELKALINNPERDSDLTGQFTFTAMILSEPEETTFDDDDEVFVLQEAWISRSDYDDYFLLDVTDIDELPETDEIVQITGSLDGFIYWTEDNEQVQVLNIKAAKVESYDPPAAEVNEGPKVVRSEGSKPGVYTFLGAHFSENSFGPVIVVYFDFENTGSSDVSPSLDGFYYYHGESEVDSTSFEPDESDSSALAAAGAGIPDKTYAGKTARYYLTIETDPDAFEDDPVYISMYNDDFQLTVDVAIQVYESLDALTAE
ncbi:MAG: hypothetical protein LBT36_02015 [Oscillospiraceae bacterium]|nr:hypothetical protein [Oscillospiraceae bacterium]